MCETVAADMEEGRNKTVGFRFKTQKCVVKVQIPEHVAWLLPAARTMLFVDATASVTTVTAIRLLFQHYLLEKTLPSSATCQDVFDLIKLGHFFGLSLTSAGFLPDLRVDLSQTALSLIGARDTYFADEDNEPVPTDQDEDIVWGIANERNPYMKINDWRKLDTLYTPWTPERHKHFSDDFRHATFVLLLCCRRILNRKLPKEVLAVILNNFDNREDKHVVTARNFDSMPLPFQSVVISTYADYCFGWHNREGRQSLDLYIKWESFFFTWPFLARAVETRYFGNEDAKRRFLASVNTPQKRFNGLLRASTRKAMLDYLYTNISVQESSSELRRLESALADVRKTNPGDHERIAQLERRYVRMIESPTRKREREDRQMRFDVDSTGMEQRVRSSLGLL